MRHAFHGSAPAEDRLRRRQEEAALATFGVADLEESRDEDDDLFSGSNAAPAGIAGGMPDGTPLLASTPQARPSIADRLRAFFRRPAAAAAESPAQPGGVSSSNPQTHDAWKKKYDAALLLRLSADMAMSAAVVAEARAHAAALEEVAAKAAAAPRARRSLATALSAEDDVQNVQKVRIHYLRIRLRKSSADISDYSLRRQRQLPRHQLLRPPPPPLRLCCSLTTLKKLWRRTRSSCLRTWTRSSCLRKWPC